jgi:pimeloyl-ACP methyl ester carboxylesterase
MGWRYQIPVFVNKGYRVIAPDCLGYGRTVWTQEQTHFRRNKTDTGQDTPDDLAAYSHRNCADDVKELALQLGASKIILGGHDW